MSNRRDFLKNISLFAAGGLLAGKAGSVNAANAALGVVDEVHAGKEIGLQIYSLSQELYKGDVPLTSEGEGYGILQAGVGGLW